MVYMYANVVQKANVLVQHRRKQSDLLVAEGVLDS